MQVDFKLPGTERLKHKRLFDSLFQKAERSFNHPLMAVWKEVELPEKVPVQVGFSVPKKHYKRAVKRNLIKRRLREAYRLNKHVIREPISSGDKQVAILFIMLKTDNISYEELSGKMMLLLQDIASKV